MNKQLVQGEFCYEVTRTECKVENRTEEIQVRQMASSSLACVRRVDSNGASFSPPPPASDSIELLSRKLA